MYTERTDIKRLAKDEVALELDDGTIVAVSVSPVWEPNNAGVVFTGKARCLCDDGESETCPHGQEIRTTFTYNVAVGLVEERGIDKIAKDVAMALIGEPTETPWSQEFLNNVNIRKAAKVAKQTKVNLSKLI